MIKLIFHSIPYSIIAVLVALLWLAARKRSVLRVSIAAIAWAIVIIGTYNGLKVPDVHELEIAYENLPAELEGYRIVQLTDLHVSKVARQWRTEKIVEKVNSLDADLICVTGDLVDGPPEKRGAALEPIRHLKAKDGVYHVTGNHEFYGDRAGWKTLYKKWGLEFLENECVFPRKSLALGGVNDMSAFLTRDIFPVPARAFLKATHDEFRLFLSHRPAHAKDNIEALGVDLQLSGHTHGGMMPGLDRIVARMNGGFAKGLYKIGKGYLYLSPGTGQWDGFPIRLFNPSEITLITLKRK